MRFFLVHNDKPFSLRCSLILSSIAPNSKYQIIKKIESFIWLFKKKAFIKEQFAREISRPGKGRPIFVRVILRPPYVGISDVISTIYELSICKCGFN